jgi:pyridoxamine 5'-phosphate oxidase
MSNDFLPEPLPESPLGLFTQWFAEARAQSVQPNPDAMVLATVGADATPSARVVLCKRIDPSGYLVFFTNYRSRKACELSEHPRAAVVMHWDAMHRQVRIEGTVVRSPAAESDEYFASRALASRVGAWASRQSEPLESRAALAQEVARFERQFGVDPIAGSGQVPRPPHWGGFRLWIDRLELWVEGPGRIHDRAVWTRELRAQDGFTFTGGPWSATRLNP